MRKTGRTGACLCELTWGIAVCCAFATVAGATVCESETSYAKDELQKYVDSGEMPGAVCVFYKDGVQETSCIGYADYETKRPITLDCAYMQCSQTKGFCGVSVALLVEEGRLGLDDSVSKYLPEFSKLWLLESESNGVRRLVRVKNDLTIRMCLNHTGGFSFELPNYTRMGGWSRRMPLRSVAATAAAHPLNFEPGTKITYSNVGIDVAAAVVEVVSGMRWEDFLRKRVFEPLGMTASGFWPTERQLEGRIRLYKVEGGKKAERLDEVSWMQSPYGDDRVFPSAGAGLWTTARDQLKFYKMLLNLGLGENGVRILKEDTVRTLLAVSSRKKGLEGYSLGLQAPDGDHPDAWFGHGGAWGTWCSMNWHKKELLLWAVQFTGDGPRPWKQDRSAASRKFFQHVTDTSSVDAYTGRLK